MWTCVQEGYCCSEHVALVVDQKREHGQDSEKASGETIYEDCVGEWM